MNLLPAALMGLISTSLMTLTESLFWRRWGMDAVAEWQINFVELSVLRMVTIPVGESRPKASWRVIASHLIHGMAASVVFVLLLPSLLSELSPARASTVLDALIYSLALWLVFSVLLRRVYEWAGKIRIQRRGILVSLLSHAVYGLSLGLLVATYLL